VKKSLFAGVSLGAIALASGVHAADLGAQPVYKAPASAPAVWSWAGFYVGANVGVAGARSSVADGNVGNCYFCGPGLDSNSTGIIGGLEAGYNWQFNNLVVGIEGDISLSSINRSADASVVGSTGDKFNTRLCALGTVRGRIGWAFDRILVYGTGGVAFASLKDEYVVPSFGGFTAAANSSVTGWVAGGGFEYALMGPWTVKAEYLHVGLPHRTALETTSGFGYSFAFKDSLDIGRVGINYKF
jgi:outer membrane immunogenic protein